MPIGTADYAGSKWNVAKRAETKRKKRRLYQHAVPVMVLTTYQQRRRVM